MTALAGVNYSFIANDLRSDGVEPVSVPLNRPVLIPGQDIDNQSKSPQRYLRSKRDSFDFSRSLINPKEENSLFLRPITRGPAERKLSHSVGKARLPTSISSDAIKTPCEFPTDASSRGYLSSRESSPCSSSSSVLLSPRAAQNVPLLRSGRSKSAQRTISHRADTRKSSETSQRDQIFKSKIPKTRSTFDFLTCAISRKSPFTSTNGISTKARRVWSVLERKLTGTRKVCQSKSVGNLQQLALLPPTNHKCSTCFDEEQGDEDTTQKCTTHYVESECEMCSECQAYYKGLSLTCPTEHSHKTTPIRREFQSSCQFSHPFHSDPINGEQANLHRVTCRTCNCSGTTTVQAGKQVEKTTCPLPCNGFRPTHLSASRRFKCIHSGNKNETHNANEYASSSEADHPLADHATAPLALMNNSALFRKDPEGHHHSVSCPFQPVYILSSNYPVQEIREVTLIRTEFGQRFGMRIESVGGRIYLATVLRGSPAASAGLKVGDEILQINGHSVTQLSTCIITELIRSTPLRLRIIYRPRTLFARLREVSLQKMNGRVGIRLGRHGEGLFVDVVLPKSPASMAGIKKGDELIKINDQIVNGWTQEAASQLMRDFPEAETLLLCLREVIPSSCRYRGNSDNCQISPGPSGHQVIFSECSETQPNVINTISSHKHHTAKNLRRANHYCTVRHRSHPHYSATDDKTMLTPVALTNENNQNMYSPLCFESTPSSDEYSPLELNVDRTDPIDSLKNGQADWIVDRSKLIVRTKNDKPV
ncbi:unnamed protein product [Calicophoron daubneyi]|uniref:PDZ domain-containing protein n=1 Tax=Calicophoron daubneyi TaxID=300641 RepID=A0AAV2TI69_CALDB